MNASCPSTIIFVARLTIFGILLEQEKEHAARRLSSYIFSNTIQYTAAKEWQLDRIALNPRAREGRFIHNRHGH